MPRPTRALAFLLLLGLLVSVAPAWAHEDLAPQSIAPASQAAEAGRAEAGSTAAIPWPSTPRATGLPWLALLAGLAAALALWRPRRALAAALVLLLCLFAFEYGEHSVHHGAGTGHLQRCPIEAASAHVSGCVVEPTVAIDAFLHKIAAAPEATPPVAVARPLRAHHGRAPPQSAS